jgi:Xaa-Pro aminopeptidase
VPMTENPLDAVWQSSGRPAPPSAPAVPHPVNYAGQSVEDKLADLRKAMQE